MSILFIAIVFTFLYFWSFMNVRWQNVASYNRQYMLGLSITDALTSTPGNPPNWEHLGVINESTLVHFGLAQGRSHIAYDKIERLYNLSHSNYSLFRERLGVYQYELYLNVSNLDRTKTWYELGNRSSQVNETVVFDRLVVFNDTPAILRLELWH